MAARGSKNDKGMLRRAILDELERTRQTPHSMAHSQGSVHPGTCMAYLYSGSNATVSTVEPIVFALQMQLARIEELCALRKLARTVKNRRPSGLPGDVVEALDHVEEVGIGSD